MKKTIIKYLEDVAYLFFSVIFMCSAIGIIWYSGDVLPIGLFIPLAFFGVPFSIIVLIQLNTIRRHHNMIYMNP